MAIIWQTFETPFGICFHIHNLFNTLGFSLLFFRSVGIEIYFYGTCPCVLCHMTTFISTSSVRSISSYILRTVLVRFRSHLAHLLVSLLKLILWLYATSHHYPLLPASDCVYIYFHGDFVAEFIVKSFGIVFSPVGFLQTKFDCHMKCWCLMSAAWACSLSSVSHLACSYFSVQNTIPLANCTPESTAE